MKLRVRPLLAGAAAAGAILVTVRAFQQDRDWGATAQDLDRPLPGDDLVPDPEFTRIRAVDIDADRTLVWRWLMRSGRPLGGWLRGRWMGQFDGLALAVALADPPNALVLWRGSGSWDVSWAFVIIGEPNGGCRLLVRTRARSRLRSGRARWLSSAAFRLLDPITTAVIRQMLLDIKHHAEAADRTACRTEPDRN